MTYGLATSDTLYLHVLHVFLRMVADFLSYAFVSYLKGFTMLETFVTLHYRDIHALHFL